MWSHYSISQDLTLSDKAHSSTARHYIVAIKKHDVTSAVLFDTLAKKFNLTIEYKQYNNLDEALNSVIKGKSDFAANITYTEARAKLVNYSSPTNISYTYFYSLDGFHNTKTKRAAVSKSTIFGHLLKTYNPKIEQVEFSDVKEAIQLLKNHDVDAIIDGVDLLEPMLENGINAYLLNSNYMIKPSSIISSKKIPLNLLKQYSDYLLTEEIQQYIRKTLEDYQFTIRQQALRKEVEKSTLNKDNVLNIRLENLPPYTQYQDDGSVKGISHDVIFQACSLLELNCRLQSSAQESWVHMYQDFLEKKFDILSPIAISSPREKLFYLSKPYYAPKIFMVKRKDYKKGFYQSVSDLISERIGIIENDFFDELLSQYLPKKRFIYFSTQEELINALLSNEIDYFALEESSVYALLNHYNDDDDELIEKDRDIGSFHTIKISIAFNKTEQGKLLVNFFNQAIDLIDTRKIAHKYDTLSSWSINVNKNHVNLYTIYIFVSFVIAIFGITIYLYRLSNIDRLTGLHNRRSMTRKYQDQINPNLTLIYLDINEFKPINDQQGHDIGDLVLKQLSMKIKNTWKGHSYRIGGDEFILIGLVDSNELNKIIQYLERFTLLNPRTKQTLLITTSMGISVSRKQKTQINEVIHSTDQAMYIAKRDGKPYHFTDN